MSLLDRIVEAKRDELRGLTTRASRLREAVAAAPAVRSFAAALRRPREVAVVAEFKRRSPSAGSIGVVREPAEVAAAYRDGGAAALSVLTDAPFFGGRLDDLRSARDAAGLPVLRKDFLLHPHQVLEARAAGADAVLLIVRILDDEVLGDLLAAATDLGMAALVEVHDRDELGRALAAGSTLIGVNSRDLATFRTDLRVIEELAREVPPGTILVGESGVRTAADVDRLSAAGVDAVLVGEAVMADPDPASAVRGLAGRPRRGARGHGAAGEDRLMQVGVARPLVKVCGLCRPADGAAAAAAGADFVGVILVPGVPRRRTLAEAGSILDAAAGARRVGVFADAADDEILDAVDRLALDVVQLHGDEPPGQGRRLRDRGLRVWKALRPSPGVALERAVESYADSVDAVLLDAHAPGYLGGTGRTFDWSAAAAARARIPRGISAIVAGGLTPGNVARAIATLDPDVVDVSSGVEGRPGEKDASLIGAFIASVRDATAPRAAATPARP